MSINWEKAQIKQGYIILERKVVATQKLLVKLPKHLRSTAIMQTLVPQLITPYEEIPPYALGELAKLRDLSLQYKISFAAQAKIL